MGEEDNKDASKPKEDGAAGKSSNFMKKIIRIVTVIAYVSGISGIGFLLSLYYIFFWDPQITGVRPPNYLKSGERIGLGMPEAANMAPLPEAFSGRHPIAHPHRMSKEFMEAYLNNYTTDEVGSHSELMEGQPTPKVMSVREGSEGADPHNAPTQPISPRGDDSSHHQGHSQQQQQQERHQQQHHQQRHRQQGEPIPTTTA